MSLYILIPDEYLLLNRHPTQLGNMVRLKMRSVRIHPGITSTLFLSLMLMETMHTLYFQIKEKVLIDACYLFSYLNTPKYSVQTIQIKSSTLLKLCIDLSTARNVQIQHGCRSCYRSIFIQPFLFGGMILMMALGGCWLIFGFQHVVVVDQGPQQFPLCY